MRSSSNAISAPAALLIDSLFGTGLARPLDRSVADRLAALAEAARVRREALDADVYLMDEVFAVGDLDFKRLCLDRMESLKDSGKTVVLVTHDPTVADRTVVLRAPEAP